MKHRDFHLKLLFMFSFLLIGIFLPSNKALLSNLLTTISRADVYQKSQKQTCYLCNSSSEPTLTPEPTATATPSPTPISSTGPTNTPTPTLVPGAPTNTPTPTPTSPTNNPNGPNTPNSSIQEIVNAVSETNIRNYQNKIASEIHTRFSGSTGNSNAAAFIKDTLSGCGLETFYQDVNQVNSKNIIGKLQGQSDENYMMTAHMDSISSRTQPENHNIAPGADDNGSGTVAVMEAACALNRYKDKLKKSLLFVLFTGEEQGLIGSKFYVSTIADRSIYKGVINLDMVGFAGGSSGECISMGYQPYSGGDVLTNKVVQANTTYNVGLKVDSVSTSIRASDHGAFWTTPSGQAAIPAVFGSECDLISYFRHPSSGGAEVIYPPYHSATDTIDKDSTAQITKITKAVVGALAELASQ